MSKKYLRLYLRFESVVAPHSVSSMEDDDVSVHVDITTGKLAQFVGGFLRRPVGNRVDVRVLHVLGLPSIV